MSGLLLFIPDVVLGILGLGMIGAGVYVGYFGCSKSCDSKKDIVEHNGWVRNYCYIAALFLFPLVLVVGQIDYKTGCLDRCRKKNGVSSF